MQVSASRKVPAQFREFVHSVCLLLQRVSFSHMRCSHAYGSICFLVALSALFGLHFLDGVHLSNARFLFLFLFWFHVQLFFGNHLLSCALYVFLVN
ncbi:hypothetical protein BJ742DRAFT_482809 [Cladochytrium replicatum]|nr:hypothetical protein BJ742DRAFT_482809 [Cladochytrium replicatum]